MPNLNIDPEGKKSVQVDFQSWLEIQDRRKELSVENKAITEHSSKILDCKPAIVSKLFKILKKKLEDGDNELDELNDLVDEIGN